MIGCALQRWSFRLIKRHATLVEVLDSPSCQDTRESLKKMGFPPRQILPLENGVDYEWINQLEPQAPQYSVVMVGIRSNKGLADIAPFWKRMRRQNPRASLLLVGAVTRQDRRLLEAGLESAGISDSVHYLGLSSPKECIRAIKSARVFVSLTHNEGWGLGICESMAAGVAVVAYDLPVYRLLHGRSLLYAPCFDPEGAADCASQLLTDERCRRKLSERAKQSIRKRDWHSVANEEWYRLCCALQPEKGRAK